MASGLNGKRILITREEKQAKAFAQKVLQYGGISVEVPLLKICCKQDDYFLETVQNPERYKWLFFTSANGVHCFFQLLNDNNMDKSIFSETRFAVVGHKTANALESYGFHADFTPSTYSAEAITKEFFTVYSSMAQPVLLVRGNLSRDTLPNWFEEQGIRYKAVEVYETGYHVAMKDQLNRLLAENNLDVITFTSPSSVDAFMAMKEEPLRNDLPIVCIGTTTETRASEAGLTNIIAPNEFTIEGMLGRIDEYFQGKG